jgi:hypothetical protein
MRLFPYVASGLVALLFASGCVAPTASTADVSADVTDAAVDDAGLPTKGDKDAGVGDKDAGVGDKDSGLGEKDTGVGTDDAGSGGDDAGSGMTSDSGMTGGGGMDAGGEMNACFACAQQRCSVQVSACEHTSGCAQEGECDLMCFQAAGGHFLSTSKCIEACTKDPVATAVLLQAATCAFLVCPKECLHTFTACGGDPDMDRPMVPPPSTGSGCHELAAVPAH